MLKEVIHARGHHNITGTHRSTFEVTRDTEVSRSGDCIIAAGADKGAASLSETFKKAAAMDDAFVTCTIEAGGVKDTVTGWGSKNMTFTAEDSMVFRVSDYVCGRTVMVNADKPAARLDRRLISKLAEGNKATIELYIEQRERPEPSFDLLFMEK